MLEKARRGRYAARALEQVSAARLAECFTEADGGEQAVKPAIGMLCEFRRHNLLEPLPGAAFDCIFIRNVLIYFDRPSKEAAIANLAQALAPGGALVFGPSDGVYDLVGGLVRETSFAYRKPG
jgi:chemotaxis protein methyltransferase CheR